MPLPQTFSLLVLGMGGTGLSIARWACAHLGERVRSVTVYGGASSGETDASRELAAAGAKFVFATEEVEGSYDVCVSSPGISEFSPFFASAAAHAGEIMGEPEFAWRLSPERWIAVTGTNGKTTTTSLVNHLLNGAGMACVPVGNIGTPPIAAVDARAEGSWFAAELSSYQLATTRELHPRVAVLLNITEDHLAWHRTHEAYAAAKRRIFANLGTGDLAVISMDDPEAAASAPEAGGSGAAVLELALEDTGAEHAAFVRDGMLTVRLAGTEHALVPVGELGIAGDHNVTNALAASAAALWVGADPARVAAGLRSFAPLEHRIEPVATVDGVRYVNDSKATNTDAVEKALTAFTKDDVVLLLGGSDKGTPLEAFARRVAASTVKAVVCFGDAQERFSDAFRPAANTGELVLAQAADLADAVRVARTFAVSGDVVLLSPACASFDEFSGFEERGRRFKELVRALAPASASGARGLHG